MKLQKYSFGVGDRFGSQGKAQLAAIMKAKEMGINITPVWNKSHREHSIIGTSPADVRQEADIAVKELSWDGQYCVDADHINMNNVDEFIEHSDFFTLDVADYIAKEASKEDLKAFVSAASKYIGILEIPDIDEKFELTENALIAVVQKFLFAVK